MPGRSGVALIVAGLLCTASCSSGAPSGGFASYVGVLGCAELVAWGKVTGSEPVSEGLEVGVTVEEWVYPDAGAGSVTVVADDPARDVAAPAWDASPETVLVVVSDVGPTERLDAAEGARAVAQWRQAGSPRTPRVQCDSA